MTKYNTENVSNYLDSKGIILLSVKYINPNTKLHVKCKMCNYEWHPKFCHILYRNDGCYKCNKERQSEKQRLNLDLVKERFLKKNIDVKNISSYKNSVTKLQLICVICGHEWFGNLHSKCMVCAKDKRKLTNFSRYGVDTVLCKRNMMIQCMYKKYGVNHPMFLETVKAKIKATCIQKYGVDNPTKNSCIRLKAARNANKITILKHWLSGEDIPCQGSYETAIVNHFNKHQIDFLWQPQTFLREDGSTYTPDLYLPEQDMWVEIKGYFYKDAKDKWEWFHKEYPNSELWNKEYLANNNIIT